MRWERRTSGSSACRQVKGVGPRLAEALVVHLDDPHRFKNGRQVQSRMSGWCPGSSRAGR